MRRHFFGFTAGFGLLASLAFAGDGGKVSPNDQVQFQQKTVEAQMGELQERMFHLADLTRDTEPDDSSRLLMAVRKAREDLILEQMRDCVDRLGRADLAQASNEQAQVLVKLEELKKLLTTTDLDLQMQLDKLKKLNAAIAKLDGAIKEERREQKQNGELAKTDVKADPKAVADGKAMPGERKDQQQNRKATEAISQSMKDLGGESAKAGDALGSAAANMSVAEGHLGGARPGEASPLQGRAADAMEGARAALDKERQKLLDDLDKQVRQQVVANLQEMLDRQKSIRGATEAAVVHRTPGDGVVSGRVKQLAPAEAAIVRICDETRELIDTTQFSVALPPALQDLHESCTIIVNHLETGSADMPVVDDEIGVEHELQDLLDTFKQLASQPAGEGNCRGCKGNKNKLLAELKTLRMVQNRVNAHTAGVDRARATSAELTPELREKIVAAGDEQRQVQAAVKKIQDELAGG